jgi:uncharacterized repeat protein (TIGR03803 family)
MRRLDAFGRYLLVSVFALFAPLDAAYAGFKIVYSFKFGNDGAFPAAGLISDAAGNYYGTTYEGGGSTHCSDFGCGTVFKIAPDGTESVLHAFAGDKDGWGPWDTLVRDKAGNLYGTTIAGGGSGCQGQGCGIVFKVAPDGMETMLHSFTGGSDGRFPEAGLVRDKAGNLYGTTEQGGTGYKDCTEGFGSGTIFEITRRGKEKILHSFIGSDGCLPDAPLLMDAAGNLYGTTSYGGAGATGAGAVFKFAPDGTLTLLYSFAGGQDGDVPESRLIMDAAGNLYGTTTYGGTKGAGVVFKVDSNGKETVLYSFCAQMNCSDGSFPYAGLVRDRAGNLYGTTGYGGQTNCDDGSGCGTVFKLAPDGSEEVIHMFTGGSDGNFPRGDLIEHDSGLYGMAGAGGGDCGEPFGRCGTVFRLGR